MESRGRNQIALVSIGFQEIHILCQKSIFQISFHIRVIMIFSIFFLKVNPKQFCRLQNTGSLSGILWQGSRLLSTENSNFPYFSVSFTFQHEIPY